MPGANVTCGRCHFCRDERFPYYLCADLHDYGNSLHCAQPPHLFGGWAELMYLLPGRGCSGCRRSCRPSWRR